MTVSLSVAIIIFIGVAVVVAIGSALDLFTERTRRKTHRERWQRRNDRSRKP